MNAANAAVPSTQWVQDRLDTKQNTLTFDDAPTANSNNPVKSGGILTAITNVSGDLTSLQNTVAGHTSSINTLNGDASTDGSVANSIATALEPYETAATAAGKYATQTALTAVDTKATNNATAISGLQTTVATKANAADVYTQTAADAKFQTLENLATTSTWNTDKASDTKYASAKAVDAAVAGVSSDLTTLQSTVAGHTASIENLDEVKATKANTLAGYGIGDAYTKTETDGMLSAKANSADVYTTTAADGKFQTINNLVTTVAATGSTANDKYPSETAVRAAITSANTDLTTEINKKANTADLGDLARKDEVAEADLASALATKINGKADSATTLTGYGITDAYTKTETDTALGGKVTKNADINASTAPSIVQYDAKGLVLSGTAAGDFATVNKPDDCAAAGGTCVLTFTKTGGLKWENIERGTGENPASTQVAGE